MTPLRIRSSMLAALLTVIIALPMAEAQDSPAENSSAQVSDSMRKESLNRMAEAVRKAAVAYQARQFEQAGSELLAAMESASEGLAGADQDLHAKAQPYLDRIERAHALLQLEGFLIPPFDRPKLGQVSRNYAAGSQVTRSGQSVDSKRATTSNRATAADSPTAKSRRNSRNTAAAADDMAATGISFVKQVAPILMTHCGRCHVQEQRGKVSLESYATIMKGPQAGVIVYGGDLIGSRLIEVIETGDMPRGGKVPTDQFQILKEWVLQGAKFDGPDAGASLTTLSGSSNDSKRQGADRNKPLPEARTAKAGDKATVSFSRDVAPLLVAQCTGCHIDAMQVRGGLNMGTLALLKRGGDSGEILDLSDADSSLLIRKLRGLEGARMPAGGRPPLADESIELIRTWIAEGANLDSGTDDQPLPALAAEAWAATASVAELSERRRQTATQNWTLGAAEDAKKSSVEFQNDDVFVVGNVRQAEAELAAAAASATLSKLYGQLPAPEADRAAKGSLTGKPGGYFRGKITLFVFPKRYDYSEFSKMVESRDVPASWDAHWRYDGIDAYVSLVLNPGDDAKALQARLTAPLASLIVASRGDSPRWFREGLGRAVAAKAAGRDFEPARIWDSALPEALLSIKEAKDLMEERLPPEQADLIGYGLGKTMLDRGGRRQFDALLKRLDEQEDFSQAFLAAFRQSPEEFLSNWLVGNVPQR